VLVHAACVGWVTLIPPNFSSWRITAEKRAPGVTWNCWLVVFSGMVHTDWVHSPWRLGTDLAEFTDEVRRFMAERGMSFTGPGPRRWL
jgi:hypothetical protein